MVHVRIKGCQELASHGVAHPFLFKGGATHDFYVPFWVVVGHGNEKKLIEKIWKRIRGKGR